MDGATAKAYMLANPGRRVRDRRFHRSHFVAVDGVIMLCEGANVWGPADAFLDDSETCAANRYVILPPEPTESAKPAEVELLRMMVADIGRQVSALDTFVRMVIPALGLNDIKRAAREYLSEVRGSTSSGPTKG